MKKDIEFLKEMQSITTELLYEKYDVTKLQHLDKMISDWKHELEQNSHKHSVMQAEGSAGAEGAAVSQRSVDTNAEARGCETCKHLESENPYPCGKCDESYCMWEAPSGGHL